MAGYESDQVNMVSASETDEAKTLPENPESVVRKWLNEIERAEKHFEKWHKRGDEIVKRYRDDRGDTSALKADRRRYNVLWANVQTLGPALYQQKPVGEVSRRNLDRDTVGRVAAQILERAVAYSTDTYDFDGLIRRTRDDYLLVGRGTTWQRYAPKFGPMVDGEGKPVLDEQGKPQEQIVDESAPCDYVFWKDFLHCPAPTWERVPWVARRVFMGRKQLKERFGDVGASVPLKHSPNEDEKEIDRDQNNKMFMQALVWEIWDKSKHQVFWVCPDYKQQPLDVKNDPLNLQGFFPCPKPLYATMTNDSTVPVPDYILYQDQAVEIDVLTERINLLIQALAIRGVYDSSNEHIALLIDDQPENKLVPVSNWAAFAEKGGLKGQVSFLPIDQIQTVLSGLYQAREALKADLDQVTGISDIVRGQSKASETATAQRIKGNFATLRLDDRRKAVAKFCGDILRLKAEIIAEHYSDETLRQISGFDYLPEVQALRQPTAEEQAQLQQVMQQAQQMSQQQPMGDGVTPFPAPNPQAIQAQIQAAGQKRVEQTFQQAVQLLRDDRMRTFRLDVEVDSMVEPDRLAEQQRRTEFLTAVSGFVSQTVEASQAVPQIAPLMGELLLYGVRGFRAGRQVESAFEEALDQLKNVGQQNQQQETPPDPRVLKVQSDAQLQAQKQQQDAQFKAAELQGTQQKDAAELEQQRMNDLMNVQIQREENMRKLRVDREEMLIRNGVSPARYSEFFPDDPDYTPEQGAGGM